MSATKITAFRNCPLAFRFSVLDRLPEPPTLATTRGTIVHRALEILYSRPPADRDVGAARAGIATAMEEAEEDLCVIGLGAAQRERLAEEVSALVRTCFHIEDPRSVAVVGTELRLEATIAGVRFAGVLDRLERDGNGGYVVTDYKTGRSPSARYEQASLTGVQIYAQMCEQSLGSRPTLLQLYYLKEPLVLSAAPTDSAMRGLERRVSAAWSAICRACEYEDFRPRPSPLCRYCSWQELCPAFGGRPKEPAGTGLGADRP